MRLSMRYRIVAAFFFFVEKSKIMIEQKKGTQWVHKEKSCVWASPAMKKCVFFLFIQRQWNLLHAFIYRHANKGSQMFFLAFFVVVNICCETSQFMLFGFFFIGDLRYGRVHAACPKFIIFMFPSFAYLTA